MKLNYEFVSHQELTETEKIILDLRGEDFCFIRRNGVLKINKALPKPKTLARIAATMWQFDTFLDFTEEAQVDELWQLVKQIAGENAAVQLTMAWNEDLREKREAEYMRTAAEWLQGIDITDELDSIGSYRPGFISAVWKQTHSTDAIFLYGYQAGMEAACRL